MTKADIVAKISETTGLEKTSVQATVEAFMKCVKDAMVQGENVYLRGFGSFIIKARKEKKGRNISAKKTVIIPAHNIPAFKAAKSFAQEVKTKTKLKTKKKAK